jgi:putative hydrolase of the HAD superfamily
VTNQTTSFESELVALGLQDAFDLVVNSARVGFAKPDERIFRHAISELGVTAETSVFVDDTAGHVEAARRLGLHAIHFVEVGQLRTELARFGFPLT